MSPSDLLIAAFDDPEPPFIGKVFGTILGLILLTAVVVWIVFAFADLYKRDDIGLISKLLWLLAFAIPPVLIIYGAVRFSRTDGNPGW